MSEEFCPHCGDTLSPKVHGEGVCGPRSALGTGVQQGHLAAVAEAVRDTARVDSVEHEIREWTEDGDTFVNSHFRHRIILNGYPGPWVGKAQIATNGVYRANSGYHDNLPRLFVATDLAPTVHEHRSEDRT